MASAAALSVFALAAAPAAQAATEIMQLAEVRPNFRLSKAQKHWQTNCLAGNLMWHGSRLAGRPFTACLEEALQL